MISTVKRLQSHDGTTIKYVWELADKTIIEGVYLRFTNYDSIGVSSQAGCNLKCAFCATGIGGLVRNLTGNEIVAQVERTFEDIGLPKRDFKVAFAGMGEPLLNLKAVLEALEYLKLRYSGVRFTLSTVGIVPRIYELSEKCTGIQLQISLHASNDALRTKIMPITKKYPIREVLKAAKHYAIVSSKTLRVNYLLLAGVNDSDVHINELTELLRDLPAYLKISRFNPTSGIDFTPTSDERYEAFVASVSRAGLSVHKFSSMGVDVGAGCGQLRAQVGRRSD